MEELQYNPLENNFTTYKQAETPEVTFDNILGESIELPWAEGITERGNYIVKQNLSPKVYISIPETSSQDTSSLQDSDYDYNYRISSSAKGPQKQLLSSTIDKLGKKDPKIAKIKGYLMDTAALESGYRLGASSGNSSALGWFQFVDSTRNDILNRLNIKASRQNFKNNPELQVLAASQLYYDIYNQASKQGVIQAAQKKGYSVEDVIHSYWLNPTWAKNFFLKGIEGGRDANGTSIKSYLNKIHGRKKA